MSSETAMNPSGGAKTRRVMEIGITIHTLREWRATYL